MDLRSRLLCTLMLAVTPAALFCQSAPTIGSGSALPTSGAGPTTFTVSATDASGPGSVTSLMLLIDWAIEGANACYFMYEPSGLYLAMDGAGWLGPSAPGTGAPLSNGQCTLNAAATTVSSAGNTVTVKPVITFNSTF